MATISYHIFMFPFSLKAEWNHDNIDTMLRNESWERDQFFYEKGDFASNFSEQGYFYDFCSGAMFDDPTSLNRVLATYQFPISAGDTYTININKSGNKKSYTLAVDKIELNIYDEKAAILCFHLNNDKHQDVQDILYINDYGRRIYPQYLVNGDDGKIDLQRTKNSFLADSISLRLERRPDYEDDFSSYTQKKVPPYTMPRYIKGLLPEAMHECRWLLDDRMYVVSYFSNIDFAKQMREKYGTEGKWLDRQRPEWYWYQYVFVDNDDPTCQDEKMFKELLSHATYARWNNLDGKNDYHTFFGVSRYSFTCLTGIDFIGLSRQTKTMYYRMASLVLAQRVLSLYYSREISEISKELDEDKLSNKQLRKRVNILNRDYLRFVNNIYFREVTPQDQGIELYDLMQEQMSIKRDEEGLSTEVEQLYHYVTMTNDEQRNAETEKLSIIATLFLVPTLLTGIWGMNLDEECDFWYWIFSAAAVVLAVVIIMQLINVKRK